MKVKVFLAIFAGILLVIFFQYTRNEKAAVTIPPVAQELTKNTTRYAVYTPQNLLDAKNTKRVLFFYASWCPTCIPVDADFRQNASLIPQGVTVIRVNYNDPDTDAMEKELADKYNVTYQHTFVQIDESDMVVNKWNGGKTEKLIENIQ